MPSIRVEMYYYTYAYLREDRTPYYIGKGQGRRLYGRSKRDIKPPKDKSRIIFLKQNLTEEEAFRHEVYMIAVFGRKDLGTGILHNRTNGGDGASGAVRNEEFKKKLSEANKGKNNSNYGKMGKDSPRYGKKHTQETKDKISKKMKGKTMSKEFKQKISVANKGKILSEETKRKMSEVRKGKKWWNDGENSKLIKECPGDGWVPGRK